MLKKWLQLLKKDERGLTLVELLAVIVILAIVGAIAFVSIGNVIENSKQDAHVANAQQLISAAKLYEASAGNLPSAGVTTGEAGTNQAELDNLEDLNDPWKGNAAYEGTVTKNSDGYIVSITGGSDKCKLTDVPEDVILEGRDQACNYNMTEED